MAMDKPMPQGQPEPQAQPEGGAAQAVSEIYSKMTGLFDLTSKAQGITPADKQAGVQALQAFENWVKHLSLSPGQDQAPAPEAPNLVPPEAGAKQVRPVL